MLEWFSEDFSWILDIISNILSTINSTIGIIVAISGVITIILKRWNDRNLLENYLNKQTKHSMKYYVPARGFNIDPCDQENIDNEPGFELIPFFLKAFKDSESQYFIILADSGMGKTSFLL